MRRAAGAHAPSAPPPTCPPRPPPLRRVMESDGVDVRHMYFGTELSAFEGAFFTQLSWHEMSQDQRNYARERAASARWRRDGAERRRLLTPSTGHTVTC